MQQPRFENQQIKTSVGDSGQLQQPSTLSSAHLSFESLYCCTNATSQAATDILQHTGVATHPKTERNSANYTFMRTVLWD